MKSIIRKIAVIVVLVCISGCFLACNDEDDIVKPTTKTKGDIIKKESIKVADTSKKERHMNGVFIGYHYYKEGDKIKEIEIKDTWRNDTLIKREVDGKEVERPIVEKIIL